MWDNLGYPAVNICGNYAEINGGSPCGNKFKCGHKIVKVKINCNNKANQYGASINMADQNLKFRHANKIKCFKHTTHTYMYTCILGQIQITVMLVKIVSVRSVHL